MHHYVLKIYTSHTCTCSLIQLIPENKNLKAVFNADLQSIYDIKKGKPFSIFLYKCYYLIHRLKVKLLTIVFKVRPHEFPRKAEVPNPHFNLTSSNRVWIIPQWILQNQHLFCLWFSNIIYRYHINVSNCMSQSDVCHATTTTYVSLGKNVTCNLFSYHFVFIK